MGGSKGNGTVFQINTDGTGYDRIYDFQGGNDAAKPFDNVILIDNTLYGMTEAGGNLRRRRNFRARAAFVSYAGIIDAG